MPGQALMELKMPNRASSAGTTRVNRGPQSGLVLPMEEA